MSEYSPLATESELKTLSAILGYVLNNTLRTTIRDECFKALAATKTRAQRRAMTNADWFDYGFTTGLKEVALTIEVMHDTPA